MRRKPKIISKNNQTILRIQTAKGERLSAREADALSRDAVPGLFPATVTPKGKTYQISFDVSGYMSLAHHLKTELHKKDFAAVLANAMGTLRELQEKFFNSSAILLNHNFVFLNPGTKKLRFIFVPVQSYAGERSVRDFYLDFAMNTVFSKSESMDYLEEYQRILNRGINVSMFDLEEFIGKLSEEPKNRASGKSRCKKCNAVNGRSVQFCAACGASLMGGNGALAAAYDPLQSAAPAAPAAQAPQRGSARAPITPASRAPVPAQQNADAASAETPRKAWLACKRLKKSFEINKAVYCIGKSADSDCAVSDNPTISRSHAEIHYRGGHFFVIDLFSTNKTFVNEQQLQARKETELLPGDALRLGNEIFEFRL